MMLAVDIITLWVVLHMYVLSVEMLHFDGKTQPSPSILGFRLSNPIAYLVEICVYIRKSMYLCIYLPYLTCLYCKIPRIANTNR